MIKLRNYRRIYRVCPKMYKGWINKIPKSLINNIADTPKRKKCLSEEEIKSLLNGHITIDEKIDGGVIGLAWDGNKPLVVGKHSMVDYNVNSKKFYGLTQWIYENYEKISNIPLGWIVYGEWMRASHNILYTELPDYFISFDIWNGNKNEFLNVINRSIFLNELGFKEIPIIYSGTNLGVEDIICITEGVGGVNNKSAFNRNEIIEGVVIRNDNGLIGKYVRREFTDLSEEHWLKSSLIENKLYQRKHE